MVRVDVQLNRSESLAEGDDRRQRGNSVKRIVLLLAVLALATACGTVDDHPVIDIDNKSGQTVDVLVVVDAYPSNPVVIIKDLEDGQAFAYDRIRGDQCTQGHLIARNSEGVDIAASEGPLCRPSEWTIEGRP